MKTLVAICTLALSVPVSAQDHQTALRNYLTDDVAAIAYLDLAEVDTMAAFEFAGKLGLGPPEDQRGQATQSLLKVQSLLDQYAEYGARYVYALFRVSDVSHGGPTWLVPISSGGDPRAVKGLILSGRPNRLEVVHDTRPSFLPNYCEALENVVLAANTPEQLERLNASRPKQPRDLADAWKTLGNGHCGLIIFGDRDSRRVVREMFPKLPDPFRAVGGPWIADHVLWGGLSVNLPPEPGFQVIVQARDDNSARVLQQSLVDGIRQLQQFPAVRNTLSPEGADKLAKHLQPSVSGGQCAILSGELVNDLSSITKLLSPPIKAARMAAQRSTRMNRFKQISLAMLNYESARKSYPPRCSVSPDGRPLLSWRVHILPYMGGEALDLYKKFKLDEPWDSQHNKQLIPLMPEIYSDPDSALARINDQGRTTFVVPSGVGTVFEGPGGVPIKEVTDGTSNTIMLLEIKPNAAPVWTRPRDWTPSSIPYEMLTRDDRDWITTGFCDGHVLILPLSTPIEKLRALITRAGGEVIKWP